MVLKPQDVFVLLKILSLGSAGWSFNSLAYELSMSASEVHAAVKRSARAGLMDVSGLSPVRSALEEFLVHGVKYSFPPDISGPVRGMPTGYAAPPLSNIIAQSGEPPPVWPDPEGPVRGFGFSPLYRSVPKAAKRDEKLYELLALVDAVRGGRARERRIAVDELHRRLREW